MLNQTDSKKSKLDEDDQTLTALSACINKIDDLEKTLARQESNKSDQDSKTDSAATDTPKKSTIAGLSNIPIIKS